MLPVGAGIVPGPRPKPTALKLLSGSREPINEREPRPKIVAPSCPKHLKGEARKEWNRVSKELLSLGLLSRIDRAALAGYCVAWGRHVAAEIEIARSGLTVTSPNGYELQSPWLAISNKALENVRKFAVEFGLSPASRSKVSGQPVEDADDDFFAVRK
jgi:P27 family predicted phage terminase small subunit